ncbi:mitochondrial import inner membrane translocase subunit Tim29-like [Patiria miniata]|uniref:Uncharacterized protein n=1 Tax=Patiria miniata TaxID=46514 RepID=A0A913Z9H3_PATMI|nr:mitochondrial import inner membrane translocase subunit Tim29-like [Patiria miniata]
MAASMAGRISKSHLLLNTLSRSKVTIPERFKEGWPGKAGAYIANIFRDYKGATLEIFTDARDRPIKAAIYATLVSCTAIAAWNNPDKKSYEKAILNASNDLALLSDAIRNKASDRHLQEVMRLRNEGRIRQLNLVVCSVMWRDDYGPLLGLYDSQCEYLRPGWRDFDKRVLDVGFMNRWYYLDKAMVEYDVNEEEFANS